MHDTASIVVEGAGSFTECSTECGLPAAEVIHRENYDRTTGDHISQERENGLVLAAINAAVEWHGVDRRTTMVAAAAAPE